MDEDIPDKLQHYTNAFMLHTPTRSNGGFPLLAEDSGSKMAWITALQDTVRNSKRPPAHTPAAAAPPSPPQLDTYSYHEEDETTFTPNVTTVY